MNLSVVLKSFCKPCAVLTAAAGALVLASCYTPPPPPPGPPFAAPGERPLFGANGTRSPNYPAEAPRDTPTGPKINRDPNNTMVDVTPPAPRTDTPGVNPLPPVSPPSSTDVTPPSVPPTTTDKPKPPTSTREDLLYGIPVVGRPGFVYSPHAPEKGVVDVVGYKRGTKVECPYTGKHFRVP